jgi:hypothetical protein
MPTKARYLADLLNASGELDSTGAIEAIQDQISSLFAAGTHTGISFTYNDSSGTFSAVVGAEFIQDTVGAMFSSNTETNITVGYEDGDGTIDLAVEQQLNNTSAPYYHKVVVTVSSGKFLLDGGSQQTAKLSPNVVYRFDQSAGSNSSHPLRFSTTSDGTHNSGSEISAGTTIYNKVGTAGNAGAYVEVCFEMDAMNPHYYYCANHSGMGGNVHLGEVPTTTQLAEGTNQYHTTERVQDVVGGMVSSNTESGIMVTYDDSDGTLDFNVNDPTISLTGDVTGSATMTDLGNVGITTTIAANSVALGTDTTGNYVATIAGTANEITVSGSGSETAGVTISLPDDVTIGDDLTVTGDIGATNMTLSGNLTVQGSTTTVSSSTLAVTDGAVKVAKDNAADAIDFGLYGQYVDGSTTKYAGLLWDASESNKFRLFHGNQSEPTTTVNTSGTGHATGTLLANVEGALTGNASTASALATARTIAVAGDVVGSASFDGSGNITINSTIQADSVALGTDTTGNYVGTVTAGTGLSSSGATSGEGIAHTLSVDAAQSGITSLGTLTSLTVDDITIDGSKISIADNSATALTISEGSNDYLTFNTTDSAETVLLGKPLDTNGNAIIFDVDGDTSIAGSPIDDMLIFKSGGTSWLLASANVGLSPNVAFPLGNSSYPFTHLFVDNINVDGNTIKSTNSDGDLIFKGNDGGSEITALTLDMSEAGEATFNAEVTAPTFTGAFSGALTGNASTATALATPRTIHGVSFDGSANIDLSEVVQDTVGAMFSSNTETGISATYEDGDGTIDLVVSGTASTIVSDFSEAVQDVVGAMVSSNTESGIAVTYEDSDGTLDFNVNDPTISLTGDVTGSGTMTNLGNLSFATTIAAGAVDNAMLSGSIANSKLSNSSITVSDGSNTSPVSLGGTLTFAGTSNEVDVAENAGTVTVGLPSDVTVSNDLTVTGNLVVSGTTTNTGATVSDSNFTGLSDANTGNATDFGFYGKYVESSTTKYAGLFYDASTDNTFRLFSDTQTVPSTTVNTSATGYTVGTLIANITGNVSGTSGSTTGNAATATALATSRNFTVSGDATTDSSQSFDGTGNVALPITLANSGVSAATYGDANSVAQVAVDAKGRVTSASNVDISMPASQVSDFAEAVSDTVGAMFSSNTESGITVTYQDADNTIDLTVGTVALGSGTSGNYVDNVTGGTGVTVSGSAGEGWEPAISIGQSVATTADVTFADIAATDVTASGNVVISGNLTVNGSSVTNSSTNTTIEDQLIELGTGNSGSPSGDSGIIIERGSSSNAFMGWDESADKFVMGTTSATGASSGNLTISTGTLVANLQGNVTGNTSGTAATVTGAAQTAITSVGTLTGLAVSGNQTVGGTLGVTGAATTSYTTIGASAKAFRNTFIHSSAPGGSDGAVGDIWITYS